jgi:hypothetical protein
MGTVALGAALALLAGAQPHRLWLLDLERLWREGGTLVGPIAERLLLGEAAGTPPILARLEVDFNG